MKPKTKIYGHGNKRSLLLLAKMIGRKHRLNIIFDSNIKTAATDGKTIYLPIFNQIGDERHAVMIEGMIIHEAMHCRFSDFDCIGKMTNVENKRSRPMLRHLHNIIEDVWGEREQAKIYPGSRKSINATLEIMTDLGFFCGLDKKKKEKIATPNLLMGFILFGLRSRLNGIAKFSGFANEFRGALEKRIGKDLVKRIWNKALETDSVTSTVEAIGVAEDILDMIRADYLSSPDSVDKNATPSGDGGEGDSATPSGDGGEGDSATPSGDGGKGDSATPSGDGGKGDSATPSGDGGKGGAARRKKMLRDILAGPKSDSPLMGDLAEQVGAVLKEEYDSKRDFLPIKIEMGKRTGVQYAGEYVMRIQEVALKMGDDLSKKAGSKLDRMLEARVASEISHKKSGKKIIARRTPLLKANGNCSIFRECTDGVGIDTAVTIVVDKSASMEDRISRHELTGNKCKYRDDNIKALEKVFRGREIDRMFAATVMTGAIGGVLNRYDINFNVLTFNKRMCLIKDFSEKWRHCAKYRIYEFSGGTLTGNALMAAFEMISVQPESKKMILLVTDGRPACPEHALATADEIMRSGIAEIALIQIGNEELQFVELFGSRGGRVCKVNSLDALLQGCFDILEEAF